MKMNSKHAEKQETNYEHYKDEIIEDSCFVFALVDGKPHKCSDVKCNKCGFSTGHGCGEKIKEWLKKSYEKPTYKLSRFEFDLIQTYDGCHEACKFSDCRQLRGLKEKGYFKSVDANTPVHEILDNCEVVG